VPLGDGGADLLIGGAVTDPDLPDCPSRRIGGSIEKVEGLPGSDVLTGSGGADDLPGRGGDDVLNGREGDDACTGGGAADTVAGCENGTVAVAAPGRSTMRSAAATAASSR
jgi:Ca2+-binding RTX toxin-like protein